MTVHNTGLDIEATVSVQSNVPSAADWEANIPATAVLAGAAVLYNNLLEFPMEFECPSHFFQVLNKPPSSIKTRAWQALDVSQWTHSLNGFLFIRQESISSVTSCSVVFKCPIDKKRILAAQVMVHAGPLQSRLLALGQERMQAQKATFLNSFGDSRQPFVVQPSARTILLLKPQDKESKM